MKIKNLLLISICLFSFSSFASNSKKTDKYDETRFFSAIPIYYENKDSPDPKRRKLSQYAADVFVQNFVLANKIGGAEMKATLDVVYNDDENPTPKELLRRGEAEAQRQGIQLLNINRKK